MVFRVCQAIFPVLGENEHLDILGEAKRLGERLILVAKAKTPEGLTEHQAAMSLAERLVREQPGWA